MKYFKNLFLFILIAFILSCSMESELDTTDFSVSLDLQHLVQNKNNSQARTVAATNTLTLTMYNAQTFSKEQAIEEVLKNRLPVVSSVKVAVSSSEPTKVSFLKIPVGINAIIVAECTIFDNTGAEICYTGTSDVFEVQRGRNSVTIDLQQIENVEDVEFSPVTGAKVDYGTNVTLSCDTIGAQILYRIDGVEEWTVGDTITIKNDVTIYAKAKCGSKESEVSSAEYKVIYKVQFEENGGTEIEDITGTSGTELNLYTPRKTGYTFEGWYLDSDCTERFGNAVVSPDDATNGVITLYAKWEPITYTVVFNANGEGNLPSEKRQEFKYDELKKLTKNEFTRDGYTFTGWNTEKNGSGIPYVDEQEVKNLASTPDAEVTLYAQWKKIDSTIEIKFNGYSDVPFNKESVRYENSTITITIPDGYSVVKWECEDGEIVYSEACYDRSSIDISTWDGGIYTVTIIFKDTDNILYSKEMQVTINKVNSAN